MVATHKPARGSPLDPRKLGAVGLEGVPESWRRVIQSFQPCEGLCINCMDGRPGSHWDFRAEGPPAFSLNILLEGRMQGAIDDGSVIDAQPGSVILMASGQHTMGWDRLDGVSAKAFRMVCIHLPQASMIGLTGLEMEDLRRRLPATAGEQSHVDAFLGAMPASRTLQRVADDLLDQAGRWTGDCIAADLHMRAKALEAIACFLRENMTQRETILPVPGDRRRLLEAYAILEASCGQDWKVATLGRAVGLNENRLQTGFQALFGSSVYACLIRMRIDAAIVMLRNGASVTDTAYAVGFSHLSHFSRTFRIHTGISPKQCAMGAEAKVPFQLDKFSSPRF